MQCPLGYVGKDAGAVNPETDLPPAVAESSLSRERKESPIPTVQGNRWTYPSPHQFYAATKAKGHDIQQTQVPVIVDIHNAVNDEAWMRILRAEKFVNPTCQDVRLVRFVGRPGERSPKSLFKEALFGWQSPFDLHDWLIDRCGQTQVRYIVDFYDGKTDAARPHLVPVFIDARPALDSFQSLCDRVRLFFHKH